MMAMAVGQDSGPFEGCQAAGHHRIKLPGNKF